MSNPRLYSLVIYFTLALFAVFAALWVYGCNRYCILFYHEQMQLFRFDGLYLRSYLGRPGGLSGYLGSFLTQFYFYPVAGSMIIAGATAAACLLFYSVCRACGNIGRLFFIPFIPAVLLLGSFTNAHFNMSAALGLLLALAGFKQYISISLPGRYFAGLILFAILYLIAGGNALLLSALMFIFELSQPLSPPCCPRRGNRRWSVGSKYLYLLALIAVSVWLPRVAWRTIYTVPLREAYFALTPWDFFFPTIASKALWLSLPALYLIWRLVAGKPGRWELAPWKILVPNCILAVMATACAVHSAYSNREEMLARMTCEVQHGNWKPVMALGKAYPARNRLACYFTNIALAESGQMPYRMFQYRQIGVAGLFLDRQLTYFSLWCLGEVYYRLGMIPEAEHCAFEALVSNPKEPNAQTMCRLVITSIERRDSAAAHKYLGYFDRSLVYRKWATRQRANLASAMADSTFHIPGIPTPRRYSDFFIHYQYPDRSLLMLLQSNPGHRLAFEYLMAYYMLQKDVEQVKWCMDRFYGNFDYPDIPTHYEEALTVYHNSMRAGDEFYAQYPVSRATRERFARYVQAFKAAQSSQRNMEQLKKQFGNTYWYYIHFIKPAILQEEDEKNRY
ncbi:MAG: DUF6057 family protein [Bacteroidales bacterium]|jgi:hypothetical protein|nr:DUF6057 family protein [Bacteroidales bacterium]